MGAVIPEGAVEAAWWAAAAFVIGVAIPLALAVTVAWLIRKRRAQ